MACPAAATCLRMPGSYVACRPIGKKIALVQCAASAASTAWVFFGQGPSSKVSTTSPSRRKSWLLKCSKPNPGPPVVSISTVRDTPNALGFPGHVEAVAAGAAGGAACAAGGAASAGACAMTVGEPGVGVAAAGELAWAVVTGTACAGVNWAGAGLAAITV